MSATFDIGVGDWPECQANATRSAMEMMVGMPRPWTFGVGGTADFLRCVSQALDAETNDHQASLPPPDGPIWLGDVYSLVDQDRPDEAADILFDRIDDLLVDGQFGRCDELLRAIDLKRLDTHLIVALLSITRAAARHLPYRTRLFERAQERLSILAPDRVERLLAGLRCAPR